MPAQRYLVTARKYRPQRFEELVAQEHVTGTLKNAIRLDRLAHAYLFSGPRGVGKTTAARILAKAINCTAPPEERGDHAEPCRTCDSCRSFEEGRSLNIIEIDAASNNKVEDIRDLRETVRVPPQGSRKKVYIVDEVHMLSNAAFNALLKTLEEPPPYVLFIFATTEPHKVLPTILSRCQRFDFRRIPVADIVAHLRGICAEEGIDADEASLLLIARKGDGALRDALSAFDQAVSLCGTSLQYTDLAQAMGVVEVDVFFEVTDAVIERSSAQALALVDRVVRSGFDLQEFLGGLAEHLRNLLVARTMQDTALIEATEAVRERYRQVAAAFSEADLLRLLHLVDEAQEALKNSTQPRLKLELTLLQMTTLHRSLDLRAALERLDRIEQLARDGMLPAAPPSSPAGSSAAPPKAPAAPPAAPSTTAQASVSEPRPSAPVRPIRPAATAEAPPEERERPASPPPPAQPPTPDAPKVPDAALPLFGKPALARKPPQNGPAPAPEANGPALFAGSNALATAPAQAPVRDATPELRALQSTWAAFVRAVKAERIHVGSLLQQGQPVVYEYGVLHVAVPDDFHQRLLTQQDAYLLQRLHDHTELSVDTIRFLIEARTADAEDAPLPEATDPKAYLDKLRQENATVRAIFEEFGGEIAW